MAIAFSYEEMAREGANAILAYHIECRLKQSGMKLARGSADGYARAIVRKWSNPSVLAFWTLSREKRHVSVTDLAKAVDGSRKAIGSWWRRLKFVSVSAIGRDTVGTSPTKLALLRRGHELFFAADGIKLLLNTSMLAFDTARHITESTQEITLTVRKNHEGACAAQEADDSKTDEERTEARRKLTQEIDKRDEIPVSPQTKLFGSP